MNGRVPNLGELVRGLNPLQRAVITVNVEGSSLRMTASRGRRILAWLNLPFNPTLVDEGQITNPQEMAVVLRNALKRLGYTPASVRAAYSASRGIVRLVNIPKTPGVRTVQVLEREARRLLGAGVDQNHIFWRRLTTTPTEQRYVFVAIPRAVLNNYLEALTLSRLRPALVELKGLALARVAGDARSLVVNVEQSSISTTLMEAFVPELVATNALDDAIAFSEEDLGLQLVEEVRAAVEFYDQRFPGSERASLPVYLTGGHPLLDSPRFPSMLTEALGITLTPLPQPRLTFDEDFPLPAFFVNVGLLLS